MINNDTSTGQRKKPESHNPNGTLPPGVREVMGLIPAGTQIFSFAQAHVIVDHFILITFHYRA